MLNPKQMLFMLDADGTITADVPGFCDLMCTLKADGNRVVIVSGNSPDSPTGPTWQSKVDYLQGVGITQCWDELVVVSGDIPAAKAQWCKDNNVDVAIDNSTSNATALVFAGVPLVLVPWATRSDS